MLLQYYPRDRNNYHRLCEKYVYIFIYITIDQLKINSLQPQLTCTICNKGLVSYTEASMFRI